MTPADRTLKQAPSGGRTHGARQDYQSARYQRAVNVRF